MEVDVTIGGVNVFMSMEEAKSLSREVNRAIGMAAMFYPYLYETLLLLKEATE